MANNIGRNGVSRRIQRSNPEGVGMGYVSIPTNVERDSFVKTCYRRSRVTIITDNGVVINECYILKQALQEIYFPKNIGEKGSCIVYVSSVFHNKPIVIGCLETNDISSLLQEKQFRILKEMNGCQISVQGDPNNNTLNINVSSSFPSKINISSSGNEESEINITASGSVNLITDKKSSIISYQDIDISVVDVKKPDDLYKISMNKDQILVNRKNETVEESLSFTNDDVSVTRKNNTNDISLVVSDEGFDLKTEGGGKEIKMDKNELVVQIENGAEQIKLSSNDISLKTGKSVTINGGTDQVALTNKLVSMMSSYTTIILNAFTAGVAAGGLGAPNFTAANGVITGLTGIDFSQIKSQVISSD